MNAPLQPTKATKPAATATPLAGQSAAMLADNRGLAVAQRQLLDAIATSPRQVAHRQATPPANRSSLPDQLKAGVENLSGHSLADGRAHYNPASPAQLQAHAYAQGTAMHPGPGQEQHLPHEARHVGQHKQGRVTPTRQPQGRVPVNDDQGLEQEADRMGARSLAAAAPSAPASPTRHAVSSRPVHQAVVQRVYLADSNGIRYLAPTDAVPPGYVRTGRHDDGQHGPDDLYQPAASVGASHNPFLSQLGFGNASVPDDDIRPDDATAEASVDKINQHYRGSISSQLEQSRKDYLGEPDSSDSEAEAGPNPRHQARRRHFKASQLTAISKTLHPLTDKERVFRKNLAAMRRRDNTANAGKRQQYAPDTRKAFAQVGQQFRQTSMLHNPYYRRAFRRAIGPDKVKKGGSKAYDTSQKKIREELLKEIVRDHAKMKWQREDFESDQVWDDIRFMQKQELSNASKGDTYHSRSTAKQDTSGSQARIGFHHTAWKEAQKGEFEPHALNPANLTGLSDVREILDEKKLKHLTTAEREALPVGAHDAFGHQGSGFRKDEQKVYGRSQGGGHFKDIDLEATDQILKPMLESRVKKRKLYQVDSAPTTTGTKTPPGTTPPTTAQTPPPAKAPLKAVQQLLAGVGRTAQQLLATLPANQGDGTNADSHQLADWLRGWLTALPLVDATNPGNVQLLQQMQTHLSAAVRHFSARLRRRVVSQPGNALGAQGERLPALAQFFAECGQMAAHNALMLEAFPHLAVPPALHDNNQLSQLGNLENDISENQIRAMVVGAGRPDIPVLGNTQQVAGIVRLLRAGDTATLAQHNISAAERQGAARLDQFAHRVINSLVLVVNTESHRPYGSQGYHWITVRLTRQPDGQIAVQYLDSLAAPADYQVLFARLRAFLGHVPPQPVAVPGSGPAPPPPKP